VHIERAELESQRYVLLGRHVLVQQENHAMVEQSVVDTRDDPVVLEVTAEIDTFYHCTERTAHRADRESLTPPWLTEFLARHD